MSASQASSLVGRVVSANEVFPGEPAFDTESGRVTEVKRRADAEDSALYIFPGFVDIHVHAREYPRPDVGDGNALAKWETACRKEVFATAASAALRGGVTAFCAMPNDPVPPDNQASYEAKAELTRDLPIPVVLYASITERSEPWEDLPYKLYLDVGPSGLAVTDLKTMDEVLARYKGCRVFVHAEDPEVLARCAGTGPRYAARPPEAEIRAVEAFIDSTIRHDLRSHICHVSTRRAVEMVQEHNKHSTRKITTEVTPHHIWFSINDEGALANGSGHIPYTNLLECNPPLRSEDDRRFMLEALRDGRIDILATDHAPHTLEDKLNGAPGMPHLDTVGPFVGMLIEVERFTPMRVAEMFSMKPAEIFAKELPGVSGLIEPGHKAYLSVLDLSETTTVEQSGLANRGPFETRCGWSPFSGFSLPTAVSHTIVNGVVHRFPSSRPSGPQPR